MRYSIALLVALSLPIGCSDGRELHTSDDRSVWVENFGYGGSEVKINNYVFNESGDLVGLYNKKNELVSIEFRPDGSVNDRFFIREPNIEYIKLKETLEKAREEATVKAE